MCKASESEHSEIIKRVDKWKVEPNDRNQWKFKQGSWNWLASRGRGSDNDTYSHIKSQMTLHQRAAKFPYWVSITGVHSSQNPERSLIVSTQTLIPRSKRLGLKSSRRIFNTISQMAPALAMVPFFAIPMVPFLLSLWYLFCSRYGAFFALGMVLQQLSSLKIETKL